MRMFVANTTKQNCIFHYRVTENKGTRQLPIPAGRQQPLADGDLGQQEIDYILKQHAPYGLVRDNEISRMRGIIPRVYSIDKPVSAKVIEDVMRRNQGLLILKGKEARKLAAVQASRSIDRTMDEISESTQGNVSPELKSLDISLEQINDPRSGFVPTDDQPDLLSEGVLVDKDAEPGSNSADPGTTKGKSGRGSGKRRS